MTLDEREKERDWNGVRSRRSDWCVTRRSGSYAFSVHCMWHVKPSSYCDGWVLWLSIFLRLFLDTIRTSVEREKRDQIEEYEVWSCPYVVICMCQREKESDGMLFLSPSHWCVHVHREGAESTTGSLHFTCTEERRMVGEDGTCHQRWDKTSLGFGLDSPSAAY